MPQEYTKEELWKIYEKLPDSLREAIFSVETADSIYGICSKNGIGESQMSETAKAVGSVLMGLLAPEGFQAALEKDVKLEQNAAKKIAQEINLSVFSRVKENLAALYKTEVSPPRKPAPTVREITEIKPEIARKSFRPAGKDTYREKVE